MFISIVITAFNEEKYLPSCLTSVFSQNYPKENYEVIIVDNNSKDKSAEIARSFGARVIGEAKQGYVYALSRGMNEAKGEVVAVTDSDTVVDKNWLMEIAKSFSDEKVVAATGNSDVSFSNELVKKMGLFIYYIFIKSNFIIGKPHLSGFNFAVRKKVFEKAGGLNTEYAMSPDVELGLRMKKYGKVVFNKNMITHTSSRRWEKGVASSIVMYIKGYFYTAWLKKSPPVKQKPVR